MIDRVASALARLPPNVGEAETALHGRIAVTLAAAGVAFRAEVPLRNGRGRLDFLCAGGVAIEAKIGFSSRAGLAEQCGRYLLEPAVKALVVLSERRVPGYLRSQLDSAARRCGKRVRIIELAKGVAA